MKHYIYITPEGTINWIEKMPEKPKDVINDGVHRPCVNHMIDIEYEAYDRYIEHEKTDSIPFEDQYRIRREIYYPNGNDIELDKIYPIELDADIQKVDMEIKSCEYCEKCAEIPKCTTLAARIIPKKEEESEDEFIAYIEWLKNQSFEGWNEHAVSGYITALLSLYQKYVEIKRKPL